HLPRGDRRARPHPDPDPRPLEPPLPPPALRAGEPAPRPASTALSPRHSLVRATALLADRVGARAPRSLSLDLHAAREGMPPRARRGISVGARSVPHWRVAGGRESLRAGDPRAPAALPPGPGGRLAARGTRRRHRPRGPRQLRVLRGAQAAGGMAG